MTLEPWLDKRDLAAHLKCSVRSIQTALAEGMPHALIFGRVKFRLTEIEPWLEQHGHLERVGVPAAVPDTSVGWPSGARAPRTRTSGGTL